MEFSMIGVLSLSSAIHVAFGDVVSVLLAGGNEAFKADVAVDGSPIDLTDDMETEWTLIRQSLNGCLFRNTALIELAYTDDKGEERTDFGCSECNCYA